MKKLACFILSIFLISTVSAEIWFNSDMNSVYNIGDKLKFSVSVSEVGEQLKAELVCKNKTKTIFLKYLDNETVIDISQSLTKTFLDGIIGQCKIVTKYGLNRAESVRFLISDAIFLNVETDKLNYAPGEKINVKGEAEKANTQLLEGFFEIILSDVNISTTGIVEKGKFEANLTLPENIKAGNYIMNITVYEKEGEEITNKGEKKASINVKQIPNKLEVALDSQSVKPGNDLIFKILLYDQSGAMIDGEASFLIENSKENSLEKGLIKIDESKRFSIEKNLSSGYYKLKAYSSGIYGERQFYVEENEEAKFEIINSTLIIKNIGNVEYNKAVQISIGNVVEVINTKLAVGEEKKYEIKAPHGKYNLTITDGKNSVSYNALLTGNIVGIREVEEGFFAKNKILAWVFLIFIMGMFVFTAGRRILKRKFVLSNKFPLIKEGRGIIKVKTSEEKESVPIKIREAEHSLVLQGQKHDTALICLKVKNELSETARENLKKVLNNAHKGKAAIYKSGEYNLIIFSPLITRTLKNHVNAVKTALEIEKTLKEYNKNFKDKIDFGVAVHSGDIVSRIQDNKLKFTSLGNTLTISKKLADISEQEVLLSKAIHEKTLADIKTEKNEIYGMEIFKVKRIIDIDRNRMFVQDFLKRMEEETREKQK